MSRLKMIMSALGGVGVLVAATSGCANNDIRMETPGAPSTSSTSSAPTTPSPSSPSASPEEGAVLSQYRAFYEIGMPAAYKNPKNAAAKLAPYATGAQLKTTAEGVYAQYLAGNEFRGSTKLNPKVAKVDGLRAEVRDCQDGSRGGVWHGDKQLTVGHPDTPVQISMVKEGGAWKVAATVFVQDQLDGYCW